LLFNSILYRTGTYQTGEAVTSFDASVISQSPLASLETNGPAFAIFYPFITGLNVNFHEDFAKYKEAYNKALTDGTTSIPVLDDYVKDDYTGTYAGSVKKGIVVRDQNSPTTFSIAPGSYQPIAYTSASTGPYGILGYVDRSGYEFYFLGYTMTGYIQDVTVTDPSVGVYRFSITGTKLAQGFHVAGTVTLSNGTVISINDDIDGF